MGKAAFITLRVTEEKKHDLRILATGQGLGISGLILKMINGECPGDLSGDPFKNQQVRDDFLFLFHFFEKNARFLSVSDEEREKLKTILRRVQ